jgi:hypothetical protein
MTLSATAQRPRARKLRGRPTSALQASFAAVGVRSPFSHGDAGRMRRNAKPAAKKFSTRTSPTIAVPSRTRSSVDMSW